MLHFSYHNSPNIVACGLDFFFARAKATPAAEIGFFFSSQQFMCFESVCREKGHNDDDDRKREVSSFSSDIIGAAAAAVSNLH